MGCTASRQQIICSSFVLDSSCLNEKRPVEHKRTSRQRTLSSRNTSFAKSRTSNSSVQSSACLGKHRMTGNPRSIKKNNCARKETEKNYNKEFKRVKLAEDLEDLGKEISSLSLRRRLNADSDLNDNYIAETLANLSIEENVFCDDQSIGSKHRHLSSGYASSVCSSKCAESTREEGNLVVYCSESNGNIANSEATSPSSSEVTVKEITLSNFKDNALGHLTKQELLCSHDIAFAMHVGFFNDFGDNFDDDF